MACVHLRQLYKLCQEHGLKITGSDLIHVVCNQCGEQEVCPSALTGGEDPQGSPREGEERSGGDDAEASKTAG